MAIINEKIDMTQLEQSLYEIDMQRKQLDRKQKEIEETIQQIHDDEIAAAQKESIGKCYRQKVKVWEFFKGSKERYPEMFQIIRYSARGENIFKCLCVDEEMVYSKRYALWNKCEIPSLPEEKRPRLIEQYEEIPEDEFKNTLKKTISRMKA